MGRVPQFCWAAGRLGWKFVNTNVVQGLWIGSRLPTMQRISIASFLARGHEYHLFTYTAVEGVPKGVVLRDAAEILPENLVFRDNLENTYAAFSDYFRYRLLLGQGGIWVDTDQICIKRFDFDSPYVFSSECTREDPCGPVPNGGVIKAPKGASVLEYADGVCRAKDPQALAWAEVGPKLVAEAIRMFDLEDYVMPPASFCPLHWWRFRDVLLPRRTLEFSPKTYAVHLWYAIWLRNGVDPDAAFHPDCVYEQWKDEYLDWVGGAKA
jgi:hypothetical protein